MLKIFLFMCLFFISQVFAAYDPSADLRSAFCTSEGQLTKIALNKAQSLVKIIQNMRDDEDCSFYKNLGNSILDEVQALDNYYRRSGEETRRLQLEVNQISDALQVEIAKRVNALIAEYKVNNPDWTQADIDLVADSYNPAEEYYGSINILLNEYGKRQVELVYQQASGAINDEENERQIRLSSYNLLTGYISQLANNAAAASRCTRDKTNMFIKIGAQLVGLAGAVYGGPTGAAVLAGSSLVDGVNNIFREMRYNTRIEELETTGLKIALPCTLQGMAKSYCEARDVKTVLEFASDIHNEEDCFSSSDEKLESACSNVYRGITLLTKKIPAYNSWINRVITGSIPANDDQGNEQGRALKLQAEFLSINKNVIGKIQDAKSTIADLKKKGGSNDDIKNKRYNLLIEVINQTFAQEKFNNGKFTSPRPFFNAFKQDRECGNWLYFFSGKDTQACLGSNSCPERQSPRDGCEANAKALYGDVVNNPPTTDDLIFLVNSLNIEARKYVAQRLEEVLEENSELVMSEYNSKIPRLNISAQNFLTYTSEYLNNFSNELNPKKYKNLKALVNKTKDQINSALKVASGICSIHEGALIPCENASMQVTALSEILAPSRNNFSVETALRAIIKEDFNITIERGDLKDPKLKFLFRLSRENSAKILIDNFIQDDGDPILDAVQAKDTYEDLMLQFSDFFYKKFLSIIKKQRARYDADPKDSEKLLLLANSCMSAALVPLESKLAKERQYDKGFSDFFKRKKKRKKEFNSLDKYCKGIVLKSRHPDIEDLKFDEVKKQKFKDRACSYYDFRRTQRLFRLGK